MHLLFGTEYVGVVLRKTPGSHQTVECPRRLVSMTDAKLGDTHRQVPIALQSLLEDHDMTGAIHRLDCIVMVFDVGREHIVPEFVPVT